MTGHSIRDRMWADSVRYRSKETAPWLRPCGWPAWVARAKKPRRLFRAGAAAQWDIGLCVCACLAGFRRVLLYSVFE